MAADRPLRVAVVGSGPAGFYAAGALLASEDPPVEVDMIERLPTPWGLVRLGVAPDHPKIKSVSRAFEKIALQPGFRFLGNVRSALIVTATLIVTPLVTFIIMDYAGLTANLMSLGGLVIAI